MDYIFRSKQNGGSCLQKFVVGWSHPLAVSLPLPEHPKAHNRRTIACLMDFSIAPQN